MLLSSNMSSLAACFVSLYPLSNRPITAVLTPSSSVPHLPTELNDCTLLDGPASPHTKTRVPAATCTATDATFPFVALTRCDTAPQDVALAAQLYLFLMTNTTKRYTKSKKWTRQRCTKSVFYFLFVVFGLIIHDEYSPTGTN